ncbi:Flowering time control protein FPA [Capsicum baccatum]|uniref:Flowering time control protein FPA n=1 Tax=Capsicum baccatum TaxID=33114 RepID=A0A2G2WJH7_CAPBA|nr:Flowering time control protein FPA [Capsicum baccatum]
MEKALCAKENLQGKFFNDPKLTIEYSNCSPYVMHAPDIPTRPLGINVLSGPVTVSQADDSIISVEARISPRRKHRFGHDESPRAIECKNGLLSYVDHDIGLSHYLQFVKDEKGTVTAVLSSDDWDHLISSDDDGDDLLGKIALNMKEKFDKYWDDVWERRRTNFRELGEILHEFDVGSSLTPKLVQTLVCLQDWIQSVSQPGSIEKDIDVLEKLEQAFLMIDVELRFFFFALESSHLLLVVCCSLIPARDKQLGGKLGTRPGVINCAYRKRLHKLTDHYPDAAVGFNIFSFLPDTENDYASYTESLRYLSSNDRAWVAEFAEGTTLLLVPTSNFLKKVLKVDGQTRIYGVVLKYDDLPLRLGRHQDAGIAHGTDILGHYGSSAPIYPATLPSQTHVSQSQVGLIYHFPLI